MATVLGGRQRRGVGGSYRGWARLGYGAPQQANRAQRLKDRGVCLQELHSLGENAANTLKATARAASVHSRSTSHRVWFLDSYVPQISSHRLSRKLSPFEENMELRRVDGSSTACTRGKDRYARNT